MTVISAMQFNPLEAAIISDGEMTYGSRKVDSITKIYPILPPGSESCVLVGGSGLTTVITQTIDYIKREIRDTLAGTNSFTMDKVLSVIGQVGTQMYRHTIDERLRLLFGISETELLSGNMISGDGKVISLDKSVLTEALSNREKIVKSLQDNYVALIILINENGKGVSIHTFYTDQEDKPSKRDSLPYSIIGSGRDAADSEIATFFEDLPREERPNVNRYDGLATLLWATEQAIQRNLGGWRFTRHMDYSREWTTNSSIGE